MMLVLLDGPFLGWWIVKDGKSGSTFSLIRHD